MAGFPWLRFVEAWMVQQLLRTPAFHRAVEKVARGVHRMRHGIPPDEMGGAKLDQPGQSGFMKHFSEEIRTQLGVAEQQAAATAESKAPSAGSRPSGAAHTNRTSATATAEQENADAAWQQAQKTASEPPKQGFMAEYMDALREQVRGSGQTRK